VSEIRYVAATGMLGSGFREETLKRAMTLKPDFIGVDAGTTDAGPHYLGCEETHFSDSAYKRDLRLILLAARAAKIPAIVGSAITAGTDNQVRHLVGIAREIAREEKLSFKLGVVYSEQGKGYLKQRLREGRVRPLANPPPLDAAVIDRSTHIVGLAGGGAVHGGTRPRRRSRHLGAFERHLDLRRDADYARLRSGSGVARGQGDGVRRSFGGAEEIPRLHVRDHSEGQLHDRAAQSGLPLRSGEHRFTQPL
jgi:hypothetical protein